MVLEPSPEVYLNTVSALILCKFKPLFLSNFLPDYLTLLKILISTRNSVTSIAILK